jgi:ribosomal-protein-alanine N-acetyltransferase
MDSVTERCPAAMLWLEVREGNTVARNFYEKYGFVKSHIRKNYYENPTDNAIIMSRPDFKSLFTKNP